MVSTMPHDNCICIHGLSSDEKPTKYIYNGSVFIEIDTSKVFLYDGVAKEWLNFTGGTIEMLTAINEHVYQYTGLSSDEKPTDPLTDSGSRFIEMDTSKTYIYDKPSKTWYLFSTGGGGGGTEYTAGDNITIIDHVISAKDTTYTAGTNITITDDNVINSTGADAVLTKAIEAAINVGGISIGDEFPVGTPIEDIIEQLLSEAPMPAGKIFWGTVDNTPESVTGDFTSEDIPDDILENGITHNYVTDGFQYECIVYPRFLGELKHIYQNSLPFDLLDISNIPRSYIHKIITVDNVPYYLYYYIDPVITSGDTFKFLWN